jgi:hypothetical protein
MAFFLRVIFKCRLRLILTLPEFHPYSLDAIHRDIERIRNVWASRQRKRHRHAIYKYLNAVDELVTRDIFVAGNEPPPVPSRHLNPVSAKPAMAQTYCADHRFFFFAKIAFQFSL